MQNTVIIVISEQGRRIAKRIKKKDESVDIYMPHKLLHLINLQTENPIEFTFHNLKDAVKDLFYRYKNLIFIMAAGIVVRLIAKHIKEKETDPAVLVLDEKGHFVISLLSGHLGGANQLSKKIAQNINAEPVITTSSDVNNKPALDIIIKNLGWVVENPNLFPKISYSFINETITIFDNTNRLISFLKNEKNITFLENKNDIEIDKNRGKKIIIVSNKIYEKYFSMGDALIIRPKNIILGIGCKKGVSSLEIEENIINCLKNFNISIYSIKNLATIDIKTEEEGINLFSKKYDIPVRYFSLNDINNCKGTFDFSNKVFSLIGAKGVCEPATILSGADKLLVKKIKMKTLTISIGEINLK